MRAVGQDVPFLAFSTFSRFLLSAPAPVQTCPRNWPGASQSPAHTPTPCEPFESVSHAFARGWGWGWGEGREAALPVAVLFSRFLRWSYPLCRFTGQFEISVFHVNSLGSTWAPWGAACSPGTAEANKTHPRHTALLSAVPLVHASLQNFLGNAGRSWPSLSCPARGVRAPPGKAATASHACLPVPRGGCVHLPRLGTADLNSELLAVVGDGLLPGAGGWCLSINAEGHL